MILPMSPLQQELEKLKNYMKKSEYRYTTIMSYQKHVTRFLSDDISLNENLPLTKQIALYLEKSSYTKNTSPFKECRAALYAYFKFLTKIPYSQAVKEKGITEIEDLLSGFQDFQKSVKCLADRSINIETNNMRQFLNAIYQQSPEGFDVSNISAMDIRNYFTGEAAHLKPSTKGRIATSIRNFFKYLRFTSLNVDESIFKIPLSPAVWKLNSIPTVLSDEEFKSLPNSFDKSLPSGVRDYAITLCFTELGLRCTEVACLSLDDFDWKNGIINIKNTKTHADRSLPMSATYGKAIVNYLRNCRPVSESRVLFLRFSHAQGEPMGKSQVRNVMRRAYKRTGINESVTGTHILRRTMVSKIYKKGASLKMVADILGHISLESTAVYTKIDTEVLLQAAGVWPGGDSL